MQKGNLLLLYGHQDTSLAKKYGLIIGWEVAFDLFTLLTVRMIHGTILVQAPCLQVSKMKLEVALVEDVPVHGTVGLVLDEH